MKTSEFFDKRYLKLPCSRFAGCLESDGHYKMNVCIIWASLRNNRNSLYKCNLPDNTVGCDVRLWRCGCEDLFYR